MNTAGHLTENQLSDYYSNALEDKIRREIGRHLLVCDFCLKQLPQPNPEQFWTALMTENDVNDRVEETTDFPQRLGFINRLFTPPKMLAWSAGGFAIALFFAVLIGFYAEKPLNEEREVTEVFNVKNTNLDYIQNKDNEQIVPALKPSNDSVKIESNRGLAISKPKELNLQKRESNLSNDNLRQNPAKNVLNEKRGNISSTRGVSANCTEENQIEMEIGSNNEDAVVFRWMKVPNASKYQLYISDDEEILIDEYETEQATSYVLKNPLDPGKTYKWKVVITLENGETLSGTSQKFSVKDVLQNQKKLSRKKKSGIRCSENK